MPLRQQLPDGDPAGAVDDHAQGAVVAVVEHQDHPSGEVGVGQPRGGHQQMADQASGGAGPPVGLEGAERDPSARH